MSDFEATKGYLPGLVGRITELHAKYYSQHWGFGSFFEAKVASELSEYIKAYNEEKDCIFSVSLNNRVEASLTIDGTSETENIAHLRWFVVSDTLRGKGVGNRLMSDAMSFSHGKNYEGIYLWTFEGLMSARHLYEKYGFILNEQREGTQWGRVVTEQRYYVKL